VYARGQRCHRRCQQTNTAPRETAISSAAEMNGLRRRDQWLPAIISSVMLPLLLLLLAVLIAAAVGRRTTTEQKP